MSIYPGYFILKTTVVLFLLGFGYLVFVFATKQEKGLLRTAGRLIGISIMTASLIIGLISLWGVLFCIIKKPYFPK